LTSIKNLFKEERRGNISLGENFWVENDKVTQEENDLLSATFLKRKSKLPYLAAMQKGPRPRWAPLPRLSKVLGSSEDRHSEYVPRFLQWNLRPA
jgi:hypothetical protein